MGQQHTIGDVALMMKMIDSDGNGTMDFEEFLQIVQNNIDYIGSKKFLQLEDDELRKASRELFDEIDADKSGSISAAELEMLYKKMGLAFPVAEINQLIQEVDTDNSGQI